MEFWFDQDRIVVNVPDAAALLDTARARMRAGQGFALATLNLDHLVKLGNHADFRAAYKAHDLVVADGNPVVWLSHIAGREMELVPGSDMVLPLARVAAEEHVPVALVGSTEAALEAAGATMVRLVPGLEIAARIAPAMGFDPKGAQADAVLDAVAASGAGMVFLALGAPRQEMFAARGRRKLPGLGFASVGAGLDFLAGTQRRAPGWVRALALEWAWRLLSAPRRMGLRYARCFAILPGQMWRAWRLRRG